MIITGVERQRGRRRVNVFVDGRFALSLGRSFAQEKELHADMAIDEAGLQELRAEDERRTAYDAAIHLLSYRPRSEREMRQRLRRLNVSPEAIDETVARLLASHYLDDAAFAEFWRESRANLSPRSQRLVRSELLYKGVDADTATTAVDVLDDDESAYRAASKRLKALAGADYDDFRRRLGGFLMRRGFGYETVRRALERCWRETGHDARS
ncbi:MAG: RecX family transcriptional regulator [Dehalococcoidia bacterium]